MTGYSIKDLTKIALMTVVIIISSWIMIPFAIPFTLQTFGIFMALRILGGKKGLVSIALYIILGAVGVPVFAGFSGGIGYLFGPTGGFVLGFLLAGVLYLLLERFAKGKFLTIIIMLTAQALCYLSGTLWYAYIYLGGKNTSFVTALAVCVAPFVVPDVIKIVLADITGRRIRNLI